MTAVGVAKPMAQGQAIIRTATKLRIAKVKAGDGPVKYHKMNVTTAMPITTGTK